MAVVVPPPPQSKLDYWVAGASTTHATKAKEQMTDIMSFHYPPPPPNGTDMALPPPGGYLPSEYSSIQSPAGLVQNSDMSPKERHTSISKNLNMRLAKPLSKPAIQTSSQTAAAQQQLSLSQEQNSLSLAAEKRRNKLGYHRTSVACGHCRRRKIRCIPSATDIQGRCANCIRLKKDCSFYPVDQQPPAETRKITASRSSVGLSPPSSNPSMAVTLVSNRTTYENHKRPQQDPRVLTKPSIQTMAPPAMKATGTEAYSPESKLSLTSSAGRPFEYNNTGVTNWVPADTSPGSAKPGDLATPWRSYSQDSPITPAFSYTSHASAPSAAWAQSEPTPREDMWSCPPPTPRSLSFGTESMVGHHVQYPSISQMTSGVSTRPFDRKSGSMPEIYASPINTTGTTLDHTVSLPGGTTGPQQYDGWQPYSYNKPNETSDTYIGWGGEQPATPANEAHPISSGVYYAGR